jgi:uncharacterized RDD family membrane protein YckC
MECPKCRKDITNYSRQCGFCNATIPPGQYLLEESGIVERSTPAATDASPSAQRFQRSAPRTASLGDRLIAAALDSIVVLGAAIVISTWSFKRWGVSVGDDFLLTRASLFMAGTLSATVLFLYLWILEGWFGATLGKVIVGIRVARITTRGALSASAIRNALRIVDGIGFYLVGAVVAGCSRLRQRLGDILAGTVVVEESFAPSTKIFALLLWLAALTGAGWALPRVYSAGSSNQRPPYFADTVVQLGYTADSAYLHVPGLRIDLRPDAAARPNGVATGHPSLSGSSLDLPQQTKTDSR